MLALAVLAVVVTGTMVGVEFAVAVFVNPIFTRLPVESSLAARSDGARVLGRVMPFWYVLSLVLMAAWTVVGWDRPLAAYTLASAVLLVVAVAMSILFLVPINSRVQSWASEAAPTDWREQTRRWDRLHYIRVAVIIVAFALAARALGSV